MNKKLRHYVQMADSKFYIPTSFQKFINKHKIIENLILKQGKTCYCTNCKQEFTTTSKAKIGKEIRCPNCKNKYIIRRFTLKNYETKKDLILMDKVEDVFVLRVFELCSTYQHDKRNFKYSVKEYRRVFFDDNSYNETVESDCVFHTVGLSIVWHWKEHTCWKRKTWNWYYNGTTVGYICPYNIKQLLKGTIYQYTLLWRVIPKVKPFDLVYLFQHSLRYYYTSFELLTKLKLYNLALDCHKFGSTKKSFEERFGVPKTLLSFMQKHNITYQELDVLRCCKVANIRLLRSLQECHNLLWLSYRVDFLTAWRNGLLSRRTEHLYTDYLKFCIQLGYDMKDKKILYPNNLKYEHDRLQKLVEVCENQANTRLLKERYKQLKGNIYKTKKYIIYPISSTDEFIIESTQQNNCVKTYIERMAIDHSCDIYLMRLNSNPNNSLVTVEVRNNKVVQAKIKHNQEPTKEQWNFLNRWQQKVLGNVL